MATLDQGHLAVEKGCRISEVETIIRQIITELVCNMQLNWKEQSGILGMPVKELKSVLNYREETIKDFAEDGLLQYTADEIKITETGSLFIRNIASSLDPAYRQQANMYSKSV